MRTARRRSGIGSVESVIGLCIGANGRCRHVTALEEEHTDRAVNRAVGHVFEGADFADNILKLTADSADSGKSEEEVEIIYTAEPLDIAFNYKFLLESLKKMNCETVKIGLNTSLSATVLKPESEEDFVCLIMPVQIR